ncbi:hypothetical protein EAF04_000418 [Stromatinia cepivora]|nr:hypothetical protein EAF04_000418 [Stromatinia cepivora]
MAAKKKKLIGASASSRLPAGTLSLSALKAGNQSSPEKEDQIVKRQGVEEAQLSWPLQPPMIEDCSDDDMDFLPTGWGKNDKQSNEDEERAEIVRKARLKKEKSQAPAVMISAREMDTATVQSRKVDFSRALVKLPKSRVKMEIGESVTKVSSDSTEQNVDEGIKVINSMISIENSCVVSTSQPLDVVESKISVSKSTSLETESSIKLVEKIARQECDLKSAKTQAGSLRAEIEVLNHKHRLEIQKEIDQLNESHQKEMEAMKSELKEAEAARQKASTDLRKVREKNSAVRTKRRELDLKLAAVNEEVVRLTENISVLETQKSDALSMEDFSTNALYESRKGNKAAELSLQVERLHSATLQQQITNLRSENRNLERKYDSLKDDYHTLEDKHNELDDDAARYRRELLKYKQDAEGYRKKRDAIWTELERVEGRLNDMTTKHMNVLHSRESISQIYQELKKAHDLREPLVKIGVDIQLRFLDQAREIALGISRDEADMALRTNGNVAAHRGNAGADSAIFKCNLVPEEYEEDAEEIFQKLYKQESSEHPVWTGIAERQTDCEATLTATKWSSIFETLRDDWCKVWNKLCNLTTISDGVETRRIVGLITRLEDLTDEIVDIERSRGRHR